MNFKLDMLYNLVVYPIITLLGLKKYIFCSHTKFKNIVDSCSHQILGSIKYRTGSGTSISKGWIVTNNKSRYSVIFDNYTNPHCTVLLKFREVFDLLFYGLAMYWGGRIMILTRSTVDRVRDKFDEGVLEKILIYYPADANIFYQIYTKTPDIPVQILITTNKEYCQNDNPKIKIFSDPLIPSDYENFPKFLEKIVKTWSETCLQSYGYEKRFIEEKL